MAGEGVSKASYYAWRRRFASQAEARMACFSYIKGWYNPIRLHSGLGYRLTVAYETEGDGAMNAP